MLKNPEFVDWSGLIKRKDKPQVSELRLEIGEVGGYFFISLAGKFTAETKDVFLTEIRKHIWKYPVIVDLEGVTRFSVHGVAGLISLYKMVEAQKSQMVVVTNSTDILDQLESANCESFFRIVSTIEEAQKSFK